MGDRNGLRLHPEAVRRGERSTSAKLTEAQVLEIRRRLAIGGRGTGVVLAREFNVCTSTISAIKEGHHWSHLCAKEAA
jgi:hypothetical protein